MPLATQLVTILVCALVLAHHTIAYQHGGAHDVLAIPMAAWQTWFINGVILVLPLLGAVMLWTRLRQLGLYAIVFGMAGALAFGIYHHYMAISPDHISHLPDAAAHVHDTFIWSAGWIALLEGLTAAVAAFAIGLSTAGKAA